jgi:hypothetical protein
MKRRILLPSLLLCAVAILPAAAVAQRPVWSHKAFATFQRPVEIPGRILPPGTYVLRLIVPEIHVGQVLSADEKQVFGIFFTSTMDRKPAPSLETEIRLEPREKGSAKWDRLIGWFSPGEQVGDAISYDKYAPVEPAGR